MFLHIVVYIVSFLTVWCASALIISSVDTFSKRLKLSSFAVSFLILGLLTSTPELVIGLTSIAENTPHIFIGNLIGGIVVIFLLVIPLLAILGNGIKIAHTFKKKNILMSLAVIAAPSLFILDRTVTKLEGAVLIFVYIALLFLIERDKGILNNGNSAILDSKKYSLFHLIKIGIGVIALFFASRFIVDKTIYFSQMFHTSAFHISLIILSLGTNLPELSLGIYSVVKGKKDVAFGDYVGSAAANTLLFGILTIFYRGQVRTNTHFMTTFIFIVIGLVLFFIFSQSKRVISRKEGLVLLLIYILFIFVEQFTV